ncbi:MAG: hypothetical protein KC431_10745, partial [Myxococcales bacterium]|nr:hypothetical protein [Myxococcales bacterium]
ETRRRQMIDCLRGGFDIPEKTFDQAIDLRVLTRNIGGRQDSNESLTYRALLLTEGACLAGAGRAMKHAVFRAYADATISRGRFLASLGNDLHRYYRTLCMDYRHKVDELDKSWAIRVLKLRHSRKLWHLANLVLFSWAATVADDEREALVGEHLDLPPLARIAAGLRALDGGPLCGPLFLAYERFLAAIADPERREHLDRLDHDHREGSPTYRALRDNADRLDEAAQAIVGHLWARGPEYLIRFGLL